MSKDLEPGGRLPDFELPDENGDAAPAVGAAGRRRAGPACSAAASTARASASTSARCSTSTSGAPVAFTQLVTVLPNDLHDVYKMKIATGAHWTFLADTELEVQRTLDIDEYTDPHHDYAGVPHTVMLAPGPRDREGLRRLLVLGPAVAVPALGRPAGDLLSRIKPDFDPTTPEARAAWERERAMASA